MFVWIGRKINIKNQRWKFRLKGLGLGLEPQLVWLNDN